MLLAHFWGLPPCGVCVTSVLSTAVTAVCMTECHMRASPAMVPCMSCLCVEHMCGLVRVKSLISEVCSAQVRLSGILVPGGGGVQVIHSWSGISNTHPSLPTVQFC